MPTFRDFKFSNTVVKPVLSLTRFADYCITDMYYKLFAPLHICAHKPVMCFKIR